MGQLADYWSSTNKNKKLGRKVKALADKTNKAIKVSRNKNNQPLTIGGIIKRLHEAAKIHGYDHVPGVTLSGSGDAPGIEMPCLEVYSHRDKAIVKIIAGFTDRHVAKMQEL